MTATVSDGVARPSRSDAGAEPPGGGTDGRATTRRATLATAVLGFFVVTLDAVVVNVALPSMRGELGGGISALQWVVDGYTLMFAALLLSAGSLSDRLGARRVFGVGVFGFVLASVACGLAPGMTALVAARFVQGAAAAVMMPSSMALISQAHPEPSRRARAIAVWAMGGAVASSAGPVLGGLLSLTSWRLIFLINVPAGAVALLLLARTAGSPHRPAPFDWAGQVTAVLAMGGLTYGAIEAGVVGFGAPKVLTAFALAVAAILAFVAVQARVAHPMVPLDLFRSRTVSVCVAVGFAFVAVYYGLPFLMSLYLQQIRGLSSLATGLAFLPMMGIGLFLNPVVPRLADRLGTRALVVSGLLAMTAGTAALAFVATGPVWLLAGLMVLVGGAGPLVMPPVTGLLLNAVPDSRAGTASGVLNTSRQIGGALAVAVFGALLAAPAGFLPGLRTSMLIAAGIALAAALASLLLAPRSPAAGLAAVPAD